MPANAGFLLGNIKSKKATRMGSLLAFYIIVPHHSIPLG
jgi:hypothetical protein